jgi:hypothetical protein
LIFDSGAWLFYQQRDPGFLNLVLLFKNLVSSNYETFRLALGIYFLVFSAGLIWFMERRGDRAVNLHFLSYIGLLPLAVTVFTTQIREGIALTIVLLALAILQRSAPTPFGRGLIVTMTLALLTAASTVHLGTGIFLGMTLVAIALAALQNTLRIPSRYALLIGVCLTLIALAALYFGGSLDGLIRAFEDDFYGGAIGDSAQAPVEKVVYWLFTALILIYIMSKIAAVARDADLNAIFVALLRYASFAVLPVLQGLILFFLSTGYSGVVVSAAIRMYESVLLTFFAIISFRLRKTWLLVAIGVFFVANQYRVLLAAIGP